MVSPEDAGIGDAPANAANAASERNRPGCDQLISTCAALIGPTPVKASSCGCIAATSGSISASRSLASAVVPGSVALWNEAPGPWCGARGRETAAAATTRSK